ncbi:hypothetical protein ABBQ32_004975 [Trebouxia sp. C0010 RCD-2024]
MLSATMSRVQCNISSAHTRPSTVVAFDWLLKPRKFLKTPQGTTAYVSAAGCFCGAILFLIAVCAACVPAVSANFKAGDGLQSTYDWLVLFCSMLGSKFFGLGCAASFILGNNLDYTQQLDAWKAQGKLGHPPRYKWIGFHPDSCYWWGGVLYILGNIQYNIASTCAFAHNFPQQYESWSANTVKWLVTVMYTSGGACYLLAGLFYVLTDTGPKFWKGVLVPTQKRDGRRLTWWINWLNFWGAVMYCIGYAVMQFTAWWYGSRMLMSYHKAVTKCNVSTQVCDTCRFTLPPCERPVHALSAIVLLYLVHLSVISIVSVRLCISKSCRRGRG